METKGVSKAKNHPKVDFPPFHYSKYPEKYEEPFFYLWWYLLRPLVYIALAVAFIAVAGSIT